ncbi:MAG: hypothetical protein R2779_04095 [Crocinitomicaceae bacterium]
MKYFIPSVAILSLIFTSCSTTKYFDTDDIYSVRTSELPVGESTADETSYAAFKARKEGKTNDRMTYADEMALINRQNCLEQWRWTSDCGCSYSEWSRYSRFSPYNRYGVMGRNHYMFSNMYPYASYFPGFSMGMGYYYGHLYHQPTFNSSSWGYYGWGHNMYSPYYNMYDPYYNMYAGVGNYYGHYNPYGFGGYYGMGGYYTLGGYGYGGNSNGWSNGNYSTSNVIRGHRGTGSGYYNPTGRTYSTGTLKSIEATGKVVAPSTNSAGKPTGRPSTSTVVREVSNSDIVRPSRGNVGTVENSRVVLPSRTVGNATTTRPNTAVSRPTSTPEYGRTYPNRTTAPSNSIPNSTIHRNTNSDFSRPNTTVREPSFNSSARPERFSTPSSTPSSRSSSGSYNNTNSGRR